MSNPIISDAEKYQTKLNELSNKHISEDKMRKDKPLANEMLKHLEACEEIFKMDIANMGGTLSASESQAEREYTTNLRYLTTFTLIGIFEKLSNINDAILLLAEERWY